LKKTIQTNIAVLITGEMGTGKELVAKSIHFNSARQKQLFIAVDLSAIPKEQQEAELFGCEKGAMAGAIDRRIGKLELASGGTIF